MKRTTDALSSAERVTTRLARVTAARMSRRTFVARLGRGVALASLTGAGIMATAQEALAACQYAGTDQGGAGCLITCDHPAGGGNCCGQLSINCADLAGGSNTCPDGSCECGCWVVSDPDWPTQLSTLDGLL
jgi:hypothetical protein